MLKITVVNHPPDFLRRRFLSSTHFCVLLLLLWFGFLIAWFFNFFILSYIFPYHIKYFSLCIQLATFTIFSPTKSYTLSIRLILLLPSLYMPIQVRLYCGAICDTASGPHTNLWADATDTWHPRAGGRQEHRAATSCIPFSCKDCPTALQLPQSSVLPASTFPCSSFSHGQLWHLFDLMYILSYEPHMYEPPTSDTECEQILEVHLNMTACFA